MKSQRNDLTAGSLNSPVILINPLIHYRKSEANLD